MASKKKPYAPIITGGGSGRFTPEQVDAAVRAVREERERKTARRDDRRSKEPNDAE